VKTAAAAAAIFLILSPASTAATPGIAALGRDLVVREAVPGRVVAVASDVSIEGPVAGDVVVWGGDVSFGAGGSVAGDLLVFGGTIRGVPGKPLPVAGRVSTPGTLLRLYLAEIERAPWEAGAFSPIQWGLRLLALAAWLAVAVALLFFFGSPLARAADRVESDWKGALLAGALGVLTIFLAAAAALSLLPSALAAPLTILLAGAAVAAKVFGMSALFLLIGQKLSANVSPSKRPAALALGFGVLGGVSLVPVAGPILWSAASVVAVGVAFLSRFGSPRLRVSLARA
jgi:hypothetical protein